jgi:hypothetical protein
MQSHRPVWPPCFDPQQAVEPDVASLHLLDLLLILPLPGDRRCEKCHLHQIEGLPTDQHTTISPFQGYQSLKLEMKAPTCTCSQEEILTIR